LQPPLRQVPVRPERAPEAVLSHPSWKEGVRTLQNPAWPLLRLSAILFLTGPFDSLEDLARELPSPIDLDGVTYQDPTKTVLEHLDCIERLSEIKTGRPGAGPPMILSETGDLLDPMETALALIHQETLERELERANSLLCAPCGCALCCTGPSPGSHKLFFEIPLAGAECALFPLTVIDTPKSRVLTSGDEPPLIFSGRPFYEGEPGIYRWSNGPSLILPVGTCCPSLEETGRCRIYSARPRVCRLPQIFSVVVERDGERLAKRNRLLAVWDCPYVRALTDEIETYARRNGLAVVYRENKGEHGSFMTQA